MLGTKMTKRVNPHKIQLEAISEDSDWGLSQDTKIQFAKSNRQLSKVKTKKRKSWSVTIKKKNQYSLKLFDAELTQQEESRESFAWAFFSKKMNYTTEQVYDHPKVPAQMNNPGELEPKLQKLDKESERVLREFRKREQQGFLPPVILKTDPICGFYVEAASDLPELTLLAEYLGQVRTDKQTWHDKNDSIMELMCSGNPNTSLVVVPYVFANVARFFNGINNSQVGSKQLKQNVRTMRCQVDGKATVLLYTKRKIKRGETLLYDYNEAGKDMYPTSHFI